MSQYDFGTINPATTSGPALATLIGSFRTALESQHSGSSRPAYAIAGTLWLDTTGTPWILKLYDGTADITLGTVNASTDVFTLTGALAATGLTHSLTTTDAGALGPQLDIYHNSASPAISDSPSTITLSGNSSTGVKRTLGQIYTVYTDPTNASEDADLYFSTRAAGSLVTAFHASGTALVVDGTLSLPAGAIISGTYTPVASAAVNLAVVTEQVCQYMRVGNVVTVSGAITLDTSVTGTATTFELTLPIASNFAATNQLGGSGSGTVAGENMRIVASIANNTAAFLYVSTFTSAQSHSFTFTYLIV